MSLLHLTLSLITICNSQIPVSKDMKTFSYAIKNGRIHSFIEQIVFEKNDGPGVITEQSFVAGFNEHTIVRYYIDGDKNATIEMKLLLGHGIGGTYNTSNQYTPWSTKRLGHNAANGALFNTIRIPFQKSITISIENREYPETAIFWYIVKGVTNYQIVIGDLILPKNTRLRLYKNENLTVAPYDFIPVVNITNRSTSGLVYMTTFYGISNDWNFLEACIRVQIDDDQGYQFLSSGTEDYFLSAFYYDSGVYFEDHAGLTLKVNPGTMSAYKFFELDPILFSDSIVMLWRNMEQSSGNESCPTKFAYDPNNENYDKKYDTKDAPQVAPVTVWTYAWVYEYDLD